MTAMRIMRQRQPGNPSKSAAILASKMGINMNRNRKTGMNIGIQMAKRIWGNLPLRAALVAYLGLVLPASAQQVIPSGPTATNGCGTLAVSSSSVALSTLTLCPSSRSWVMPFNGTLYIKNSGASSGKLYVCPFGGTCTTSTGLELSVGDSWGLNLGGSSTSPTIISDSTATAVVLW